MSEPTIPSPCTKSCRLKTATTLCGGCQRTIDEIARWGDASDLERALTLGAVLERRDTYVPGPDLVRDNERK